ncbi:MAG: glutamyl-tRNA(Gln) amidotransferase [Candidatus Bathyarchaeota archaeon B26-1]|nr:MAG: glutamyl-tRNA(Gln) amidotransferase [Candidatus Bathyarchaeota archaeon B26-1]
MMSEGVDYSKIGLLVGLECHQQLATRTKLFCSCKPSLFKGEPKITFVRRLRPTQSELGQVDPAAYFEFKKGVRILYEADNETSCLVEMDEEPPHPLNPEAIEVALTVALMMNAKPVDEIHVMRKTVIDGSNTTGFQRTCVVALNGSIEVEGRTVPIEHISLEEDAARKTGGEGFEIRYRIDRLGIPLIEVTTGPVIRSPREAQRVALAIGRILRATKKVRRGIGTIRQDLNVSIRDGALIEIKGVQELELISKVVEYEAKRQLGLLEIRDELKKRGLVEEEIREEFHDATELFKETGCRVLKRAINQGKKVLAVKLPKFSGLLSREIAPGMRLGREMADRARFWGRVGGIFHTDELPAYGVTEDEVDRLKRLVGAGPEDAVVFVADSLENATDALRAVVERAKEALRGVPEETRAANPDGTTRYMRPRPGAARMYPETDIPPIRIDEEYLQELASKLPELPEEAVKRLMKEYNLNEKLANQLVDSEYLGLFEEIVRVSRRVSPRAVAATLTETFKALRRDGVDVGEVSDEQILEVFRLVDSGRTTKEAIPEIITWLSKHRGRSGEEAVEALGLTVISGDDLRALVDRVLQENAEVVRERGEGAFGFLMGYIMKRFRGRLDAKVVSELLRERLKNIHGE